MGLLVTMVCDPIFSCAAAVGLERAFELRLQSLFRVDHGRCHWIVVYRTLKYVRILGTCNIL